MYQAFVWCNARKYILYMFKSCIYIQLIQYTSILHVGIEKDVKQLGNSVLLKVYKSEFALISILSFTFSYRIFVLKAKKLYSP